MMQKVLNWKLKKVFIIFIFVCIFYAFIHARNYEHKTQVFIPKTDPNVVWEFVADFSNMKYLNPTLEKFNIIKEEGNYEHWKYTVEYFERLSHWPNSPHVAIAQFSVKADPKKNIYYINSIHKTCLFSGLYCLDTTSVFKFTKSNISDGAVCEESLVYQCPMILKSFCEREVVYQRRFIMNNLLKKFAKN